ncbi:hypothetical protein FFZ77_01480 [Streptomyces katsurahamanus]|uniref:DUF4242 domain-containing protein n=1 Tax=Streptomyces katsurahamanus TaxID=2577098 RepID=A0ABW9NMU3_9ACTN|nr:hypothetical protein [Streptomyces katsurahamanus]
MTDSQRVTGTVRNWYFSLVLDAPLTEDQSNTLDHLDRFNDGRIGLAVRPGYSRFLCSFEAETLTEAVAEALGFFEEFPGVLIRSVEMDHFDLRDNGMATPAVVPTPPPVKAAP